MIKQKLLIVDENIDDAKELEARLLGLGYEVAAIAASEADAILP